MIKITVASSALNEIPYTDKKDQTSKVLRLQHAYAHTVDSEGVPGLYPEKFEFIVPRTGIVLPGEYMFHPSTFYVQNGRMKFYETRWVPVKSLAKAA